MRAHTLWFTVALAMLTSATRLAVPARAAAPPLLVPTDAKATLPVPTSAAVRRFLNVNVRLELLRAEDNRALLIPLFGDRQIELVRERQEPTERNGFVWIGRVAGQPMSFAALSTIGEVAIGQISTENGEIYQITYAGGGVHRLEQLDPAKIPQEAQPIRPKLPLPDVAGTACLGTDPPDHVDAMVLYTATTRAAAGGTDAMVATVYLAAAETNQSYINGQVNHRLRLVHIEEVSYAETGNLNTDLSSLQSGAIPNVLARRDAYGADVVSLIVENGGPYCGLGYFMSSVSPNFESYAFSVVARPNCATGYYSFGHEIGHNMSADHDQANSTSTGPYPFNHGYIAPSHQWRTVMAYGSSCANCTRLPYWSNPNVSISSVPTGTVALENNAKVLNLTAPTVANFRCSSPAVTGVWMKDTWNDTGKEPDPATANEDMWVSPYIWVRNTQDTTLVHQHQHENPEVTPGQPVYVYVKLHNSGPAATGKLRLHFADANIGLHWQADWTDVNPGGTPVTIAAHATAIVEVPWIPPHPGHLCMIARWDSSADPMTFPEGQDINANTRQNNNVVWRNLNVVDLVPDTKSEVSFVFKNPRAAAGVYGLAIRAPRSPEGAGFFEAGRVVLLLDPALYRTWVNGGRKGKGFRLLKAQTFALVGPTEAVFDGLSLTASQAGNVKLKIERTPTTPRRSYAIQAVQLADGKAIGGVGYQIRTTPLPSPKCRLDEGLPQAGNTFARPATLAQTFTPTKSGPLARITHGLRLAADSAQSYDLLVTATSNNLPTWRPGQPYEAGFGVLYSLTGIKVFASGSQVDGAVPVFDGPQLRAGTTYALILLPVGGGRMYWRGNSSAGSYPRGSAYEWSGTSWVVPATGPKDHGFFVEGSDCR